MLSLLLFTILLEVLARVMKETKGIILQKKKQNNLGFPKNNFNPSVSTKVIWNYGEKVAVEAVGLLNKRSNLMNHKMVSFLILRENIIKSILNTNRSKFLLQENIVSYQILTMENWSYSSDLFFCISGWSEPQGILSVSDMRHILFLFR